MADTLEDVQPALDGTADGSVLGPELQAGAVPFAASAEILKQRSVRGAVATLGSQGVRFVLQFGSQVALAHWLDPAEFGLVAMAAPVLGFVQIFNDLGLGQATVQRPTLTERESSGLFWVNLAISFALAVLVMAFAGLAASFYHEPKLTPVMMACGALLLLSGVASQPIALMNRHMRFSELAMIDIACAAVAAGAGLTAASLGCGYWSLVIMQLGNALTVATLAWWFTDWRPCAPWRAAKVWSMLRFGGHLTGFNLLGYAENYLAGILLGRIAGSAALGLFDRGNKLVSVPWWQLSLPVSRVAVSLLSRLAGQDARYGQATRMLLGSMLLVVAPGLLWVSFDAKLLVTILLGNSWSAAAPVISRLALATMLGPFGLCAYWLFVSQGRVREQLRYGVASSLGVVAAVICGIGGGPDGVAASLAAFSPFVQGVQLWGATRRGPVTLASLFSTVAPVVFGLIAAGSAMAMLREIPAFAHLPALAALGVMLVVVYGVTAAATASLPRGRVLLAALWRQRRMLIA